MKSSCLRLAVAALVGSLAGCHSDKKPALTAPDLGTQEIIGREFIQQRGCPTCHQSSDAADGTLSGQLAARAGTTAYGANLTPDVATGLGGWADIEIVRAMRFGVDNEQQPLCPPMPHFDGSDSVAADAFMTDVEADSIIAYLRSLPPVARSVPESMCPPLKPAPPADLSAAAPSAADLAPAAYD